MLHFEPFASSSSGCCYRVSDDSIQGPLLLDAGIPYKQIQQRLNFRVSELAGCLVTHAHGDHCKAVADLTRAGVNCYASPETWAQLKGITAKHRCYEANPRQALKVGDWKVMPFEAVHDMPGTLGFLVSSAPDGNLLLYLTDSAYTPYKFDGLTHIAIEANFSLDILKENVGSGAISSDRFRRTFRTHMSLERLLQMLRANDLSKVQRIYLLHLSDANSDAEAFKDAVERATGRPTTICAA